jgi:hypothetical protein
VICLDFHVATCDSIMLTVVLAIENDPVRGWNILAHHVIWFFEIQILCLDCWYFNVVTLFFRVVEIYSSNVTLICVQIIVYVNAWILLHTRISVKISWIKYCFRQDLEALTPHLFALNKWDDCQRLNEMFDYMIPAHLLWYVCTLPNCQIDLQSFSNFLQYFPL